MHCDPVGQSRQEGPHAPGSLVASTQYPLHSDRPPLHVTWQVLLALHVVVALIVVLHGVHAPSQQIPPLQ